MTFAPLFQRVFSSPFDRRAAAANPYAEYFDHLWIAKGAASLAASYVDLVGSQTITAGVAPTLTAAGWSFDAASTYLIPGLTPPATATWSFVVAYSGVSTNSRALYGQLAASSRHYILPKDVNVVRYANASGIAGAASPELTAGVLAVAGSAAYRNGVDESVSIGDGSGTVYPIFIGALNRGSSITNYFEGVIAALGVKKSILTPAQVAAASSLFAAL